jgi:hypothetical protein
MLEVEMWGVVATESMMFSGMAPGVTVADGANDAVAPTGNAETLSVTGLGYVPFRGASTNANVAVSPP